MVQYHPIYDNYSERMPISAWYNYMKRVMVIGCPGSGKSTFSIALAELTALPLCHLDMLNWRSDRTTVDKTVFNARLDEVLKNDKWLIDGNYGASMEKRMMLCDTVFFLDYPTEVCLDGIRSRRGKARPDMPFTDSLDEEADEEFIDFIKSYNETSRPKVFALLEKYNDRNIVIFHSRMESDEFLEKLKRQRYESN